MSRSWRCWGNRMLKGVAALLLSALGACSGEPEGELYFVGDSLVAGWDVREAFPTYIVRNDGVSGARLEDILTWNLDYRDKDVVMLIGTNNLGYEIINESTRWQFIEDFVEEYRLTIETLAPRKVFVISILPRNFDSDDPSLNLCIEEMNFALSQMVNELSNGVFVDVHDDFLYKGKLNMNYSLDGLHLNDLGYNILSKRLSQVL